MNNPFVVVPIMEKNSLIAKISVIASILRRASTGAGCEIVEVKPGQWYYGIEIMRYSAWDEDDDGRTGEYEWYGPFRSERDAIAHLRRSHANPGGWMVTEYSPGVEREYRQIIWKAKRTHGSPGRSNERCPHDDDLSARLTVTDRKGFGFTITCEECGDNGFLQIKATDIKNWAGGNSPRQLPYTMRHEHYPGVKSIRLKGKSVELQLECSCGAKASARVPASSATWH